MVGFPMKAYLISFCNSSSADLLSFGQILALNVRQNVADEDRSFSENEVNHENAQQSVMF